MAGRKGLGEREWEGLRGRGGNKGWNLIEREVEGGRKVEDEGRKMIIYQAGPETWSQRLWAGGARRHGGRCLEERGIHQ